MNVLISNIQRFSLHDGPGIRTTVFFMGCSMCCPWCSNPENLTCEIKNYNIDEKNGTYGKYYSENELISILLRDTQFYQTGGGVTYSGGECLLQLYKLKKLLYLLRESHISQCIETSLNVQTGLLEEVLPYLDLSYIDLKIFTDNCAAIGFDRDVFFKNLDLITHSSIKFIFRIPLVRDITVTDENLTLISKIVNNSRAEGVEIFNVHSLAEKKYNSLGLSMNKYEKFDEDELNLVLQKLSSKIPIKVLAF